MRIANEEIFGPVAPLYRFTDEAETLAMANADEYGIVGINTGIISTEVAPFGGVQHSGLAREGSRYGIEEYMAMKHLNMA